MFKIKKAMTNCTVEQLQELISYATDLIQYKDEKVVVEFADFWSDLLEIIENSGHTNMMGAIAEWYYTNPRSTVILTKYHYHILAKNAVLWANEYNEDVEKGNMFCKPFYVTEEERKIAAKYEVE